MYLSLNATDTETLITKILAMVCIFWLLGTNAWLKLEKALAQAHPPYHLLQSQWL